MKLPWRNIGEGQAGVASGAAHAFREKAASRKETESAGPHHAITTHLTGIAHATGLGCAPV
jgi:hypothetical protein